jgi:hypothetical protein
MKNRMPKLEAGMLVTIVNTEENTICGNYVCINDTCFWNTNGEEGHSGTFGKDFHISAVYKKHYHNSFNSQNEYLEGRLLWKLETETDAQIKKLEKTISDAQEQLQEIKRTL